MDAARAAEKELAPAVRAARCTAFPSASRTSSTSPACRPRPLEDPARQHRQTGRGRASAKLRAAGAIIMGKLSTHEFAIGGPSFDLPFPPARNPWNPRHHPGGSSSGSGAGVASGMFPLALGTDTGGSVRNPASVCGIVGLKPTYGLVSRRGVFPLAFTLDHVGPLTRTVADNALLLDALAGHDPPTPAAPRPMPVTSAQSARPRRRRPAHRLRAALPRNRHARPPRCHRRAGGRRTRPAGRGRPRARPSRCRNLASSPAVNRVILGSEAWSIHAPWLRERPGDYGALARRRLLPGAFMTAGDYVGAQRRRAEMIAAVNDKLRDYDVLMCASSMDPASEIEDAAGDRAHLSAAGPRAVQRHRPSRAGDDVGPVGQRPSGVGAVRRPLFRGRDGAARCRRI
jgi:aspartyl-tRNA(Asn)/glutamyl-tRNA(Gln) amidotransferase subunit A